MNDFADHLDHKKYLKITIPFIVSTVTQPLLGAVDTAVVGQLGAAELIGGVAVGTVIMNTLYWLFGFFRVSTTGQSAIALGKNCNKSKATSLIQPFVLATLIGLTFILSQSVLWSGAQWIIEPSAAVATEASKYFSILIWGAPFVLLNYTIIGWLMGQAKVKETLFTQILGNVLNIVLDLLFVLIFEMGVTGVAIATLISQITTFIIGIVLVQKSAGFSFKSYLQTAKISAKELKTIASSNTDLLLRTVCILVMFNAMARFGSALGEEILATNAIVMQITFMISYMFDGIANASSVFAGKSVGKRSPQLLDKVLKLNFQWTSIFVAFLTLFVVATQEKLVLLFTDIPEIITQYNQLDLWITLFPLVAGYGLTIYGIFTGSGTTRPVRNSTFMALILFILTIWLALESMENQGLWLAFTLFYVGRFVFLFPYIGEVKKKCGKHTLFK